MIILCKMVNTSSDDVIAPLIATLAKEPSEFSQASGLLATKASIKMVDRMVQNQSNIVFRDVVSRSKSLLAAMGMVMKSTSVNLDPNLVGKNESNSSVDFLLWEMAQVSFIVCLTIYRLFREIVPF